MNKVVAGQDLSYKEVFIILSKGINDIGQRLLQCRKMPDNYKPFAATYYTYIHTLQENPTPAVKRRLEGLERELFDMYVGVFFCGSSIII